jgi:DHA2 family methylenomycin A resistance protein-like MFS transporter
MLPLKFFRAPGFSVAVVYGVIVNLTYYGIVFLLSLYLQRVHGYSALRTGLAYLPLTATFFGINVLSGWLVGRIGARWPMVLGALIDAVGFLLFLPLDAHSAYLLMLPAFALLPCGMGLGVLNAARQAAGAIGVALFGSLAGDNNAQVVSGLHSSAWIALGMLLLAAALAFRGIAAHTQPKR